MGRLRHLWRGDRNGATALEFAFVAPVFVTMIIGLVEFSVLMTSYVMLNLAVNGAARDGIIGDNGNGAAQQEKIRQTIIDYTDGLLNPNKLAIRTEVFGNFDEIVGGETYTDANGNNVYDEGEWHRDSNENGFWDAELSGEAGLGGPDDIVLYEVTYAWTFLTPFLRSALGESGAINLQASLAVRNEPFPDS